LTRHGGDVLLSDTVGFIRRLPEHLFASFASTLAEVAEASLLLVVVDASDAERARHLETTDAVLERLGAAETERLIVFNKADRLEVRPDPELARLAGRHAHMVISSRDGNAVSALRETILHKARSSEHVREIFVPYARHDLIGRAYAECRVLRTAAAPSGTQIEIAGKRHVVESIARAAKEKRS
jgi:GTP-binding protein HflX